MECKICRELTAEAQRTGDLLGSDGFGDNSRRGAAPNAMLDTCFRSQKSAVLTPRRPCVGHCIGTGLAA
jgi:hypothetical protein